ncbi:hypothetical protein G7Y79_00034g069100 [Physcia stellaris]|nr:hypothetical protein G7Y79_00034g069100 [Physcia stellaris]
MKSLIALTLTSLLLFTQTLAAPLSEDLLLKRVAVAQPLEARLPAPEAGLEARRYPPDWKREAEAQAGCAPHCI